MATPRGGNNAEIVRNKITKIRKSSGLSGDRGEIKREKPIKGLEL